MWEVSYAGSAGKKLYEFRNPNQPLPTADPNADVDPRRPRPFLGSDLTYWCSCGSSTYHSLQTKVEKRFSNNLSFLGAYTFGKSIDEQSQASLGFDNSTGVRSEYNYRWEKARSDFNQCSQVRGQLHLRSAVRRESEGRRRSFWPMAGSLSVSTPSPPARRTRSMPRTDFSNTGGERVPTRFPAYPRHLAGGRNRQEWFNPAAFTNPASGQFGNVGRNTLTGPGNVSIDFSLFKNFPINDRAKVQFRTEFFNLINHPNFRSPSTYL